MLWRLDQLAKRKEMYVLREKLEWKVYSLKTGKLLATVYPDSWRFLLHFGSCDYHNSTNAFAAVVAIAKIKGEN